MNTFDPENHEETWAHLRTVREATGGNTGRCLDCGDRLPVGMDWHRECWLRERRITIAAEIQRG